MLDEKGTAAALKEAYRRGGYRFVYTNGIFSVRADRWALQAALVNVPAKVLGLITEHLGSIVEEGFAFLLKKDQPEQSVMVDQEITAWQGIRMILDGGRLAPIKQTPLSYNGYELWQEQRKLKTCLVDPGITRVIEKDFLQEGRADLETGNLLLWTSMGGTIAYVTAEPDKDNGLERLDGYPWCGE